MPAGVEVFADGDVQAQLKAIKKELKEWERTFVDREGRKPDKNDIAEDREIARRYKLYAKLKNQGGKEDLGAGKDASAPKSKKQTEGTHESDDYARERYIERDTLRDEQKESRTDNYTNSKESKETRRNRTASKDRLKSNEERSSVASSSSAATTNDPPKPNYYTLPDNFRLKRTTVASGPISTVGQFTPVSRPSSAGAFGASVQASISTNSPLQDFSTLSNIFKSTVVPVAPQRSPPSDPITSIMDRKRQIESIARASTPTKSPSSNPPNPLSSTAPASSSASQPPRVTQIVVQATPEPPATDLVEEEIDDEPAPPVDYTELAKPYDPTEDDEEHHEEMGSSESFTSPRVSEKSDPGEIQIHHMDEGELNHVDGEEDVRVVEKDSEKHIGSEERNKDVVEVAQQAAAKAESGAQVAMVTAPGGILVPAKPRAIENPPLFRRLLLDGIIRCRLYRKKTLYDKAHPIFTLFNETDDKFLLAARKRKKSKSVHFVISTSQDDLTKDSKNYVAKLKANYQRTNFILYDARSYVKNRLDKGLREAACISYSKTVLPREMSVAIPSLNQPDENANFGDDEASTTSPQTPSTPLGSSSRKSSASSVNDAGTPTGGIMADVKSNNGQRLLFLRNKSPRWNEATQSHCLNFGGRVTQPSIKNFQLIAEGEDGYIVMQFGRCGTDYFTLDARFPLTPLEAFAIALTTFDAYDSA
ncbi:Tub family-domain-containing protein [Cladochytrium replicatum]|nr:Tub family-domain-containing protein [Cladochytrium replicatum]